MPSRNVGSPFSVKRVSRTPSTVPPVTFRPGTADAGFSGGVSTTAAQARRRNSSYCQSPLLARLAGDDQVEARHEGDQLASGAGLGAGVRRDAPAAPASLARQARRQLPAVGEDLGVDLEAHLRAVDVVGGCGGLFHEPLRDHLRVIPAAAVGHAVGDPGHLSRRHAQPVRRMTADLRVDEPLRKTGIAPIVYLDIEGKPIPAVP